MFFTMICESAPHGTLDLMQLRCRNGYQWNGKGKWVSMTLRRPKKSSNSQGKKSISAQGHLNVEYGNDEAEEVSIPHVKAETDPGDPNDSLPLPRYNAMLAVLRNTLYM